MREKDHSTLRNHGHKLKCVSEPEKLAVWGDYDSTEAQNIGIGFFKCDNATSTVTCKSEAEIKNWMKDKFLIILTNLNEFVSYRFDENQMMKYSRFYWV